MNKIIIIGHLGKDPETRFTASGQKVTTFSVATNKRKGDQDETTWFRVTVWGDRFDKMMQYFKKGSVIFVSGELALNKWTDASGQEKTSLEITADSLSFLPGSRDASKEPSEEGAGANRFRSQKAAFEFEPSRVVSGKGNDSMSEEEPLPF